MAAKLDKLKNRDEYKFNFFMEFDLCTLIGDIIGKRSFQFIILLLDGAGLEPKATLIVRPNFGFPKIVRQILN